jgi:putative DNA methylase
LTTYKPKLIEVALPLAAINDAAGAEGSVGQRPHPKNLHRWWARRPLAAARAVLWASLVDDPSGDESLTSDEQESERSRLFDILERLVLWESSSDMDVLREARAEIDRCFPDGPPAVVDPFGGGGAIPLEAHRLGLVAHSGDLNPVAVLIQRAMIEIPSRFRGMPPVNPEVDGGLSTWQRAQGLAADIEAYGKWMGEAAHQRLAAFYPVLLGPNGQGLTTIAWIWARTVQSPDPSWTGHVPLVASWTLANKKGQPRVWIEPVLDSASQSISYEVRTGGSPTHDRTVTRGNGVCIATGATIPYEYIRDESLAGRMGEHLMAVVAEGESGRVYLSASEADRVAAESVPEPPWKPTSKVGIHPRNISTPPFGLDEWWKLFSPRQLLAMVTLSDLLPELHAQVRVDALASGLAGDGVPLRDGGQSAEAYADAVVTYLAFAIDKMADFGSNICSWNAANSQLRYVFSRQAIPMTWDFAEVNPFSHRMASWDSQVDGVSRAVSECLGFQAEPAPAFVSQRSAAIRVQEAAGAMLSSDPPYYDNISYADLSDFFYVWLRKNLAQVWPDECATLLTPKAEELIANQYRAGSKVAAKSHFEEGMADFMTQVAGAARADVPVTIYYAYKATETSDGSVRSTGWDTFLQAVVDAGIQINATWPLRTERRGRSTAIGTNALASSIVLACRPRRSTAPLASRGEFMSALRDELPEAVRLLQTGNIAPVDIAQSTIGPGIKVFTRYARVVEADGSGMPVADALAIINDVLGEVLDGEEAELDADTRFASTWYAQFGYSAGPSGDADGQARAKNTSLSGIGAAGIGEARGGSFRLFKRSELDPEWDVVADTRLTVWEATQHLVAALERSETEAADLLHRLGGYGDRARQLAYVLFQKATDKGWAEEAGAYNGLILAWPTLQSMGSSTDQDAQQQLL